MKNLPKGFRYFFTKNEIKEVESISIISFEEVRFGHVTNSESFSPEKTTQSSFRALSISANQNDTKWAFFIYQSGFRNELLPEHLEKEVKQKTELKIIEYLKKIQNSKETDFQKRPQLWIDIDIKNDQAIINSKELK